jgi:hypothetical protein
MDILLKGLVTMTLAGLALSAGPALADVYRCRADGVTVFTDRPCGDAAPMALPPPTVIPRGDEAAAREYDRRIEAGRQARDEADAEWLDGHEARKAQLERSRSARIAGTVVEGMLSGDVRALLGSPDEVRSSASGEQWLYRPGQGVTRTITFRDGAVVRISETGRRKRK